MGRFANNKIPMSLSNSSHSHFTPARHPRLPSQKRLSSAAILRSLSCALALPLSVLAAPADMATDEKAQARAWFETAFSAEPKASVPFSFVYGGAPSSSFLTNWEVKAEKKDAGQGKEQRTLTYTDPATHLEIRCEATLFADSPAVEWVLYATNKGDTDSPVLEKLLPLNLDLDVPEAGDVTLHYLKGSKMTPADFLPMDTPLGAKGDRLARTIDLTATGGRSSAEWMPYFNLEYPGGGIVGAIGWSGQWTFQTSRADRQVHLQAGQQNFRAKLHPGESVRSPRMLLLFWKGDEALRGNNLFRRLMLAHYVPRINGEVAIPPNALMTWFTYSNGSGVTEKNQLADIQLAAKAGCEAFWIDAGWFESEGDWSAGVGNWVPKPEAFPNGLKPLGDEAHRLGMKFIVWFEPERVRPGTRIAKEHPEWLLHRSQNPTDSGLFNLGDPAARAWMTDLLSKCIGDWGIDVLRIDFNIDPAAYWQSADTTDRKGITEARYIEGLYKMWDDLKARHPGLLIDNCASGGRRLDFELLSRSYPLWQSDTQISSQPQSAMDQAQNAALSLYLPLHSGGVWAFDPYRFRSMATTGLAICPDLNRNKDQIPQVRRMLEESKSLRPLALGDYYPLTEINSSEQNWCAWQYDRPDLGQGYVMVFRRSKSPFVSASLALHGLDPGADYVLTNADTQESKTVNGAVLAGGYLIDLTKPATNLFLTYRRAGKK